LTFQSVGGTLCNVDNKCYLKFTLYVAAGRGGISNPLALKLGLTFQLVCGILCNVYNKCYLRVALCAAAGRQRRYKQRKQKNNERKGLTLGLNEIFYNILVEEKNE